MHRLGLGAMRIMQAGPEGAKALLRRALELGVNLIDTADVYGRDGASERLIAEALRPYPDDLVIATKGGQVMGEGKPRADGRPDHLRSACEASLRRLGLETIGLYQLHNADPNVPLEESLGALVDLRTEGKIRHIGVCNLFGQRLEQVLETTPVVTVQNRYNVLERATEQDLHLCERLGIAFVAYAPLGAGTLTAQDNLQRVADAHGATPAQTALSWLLHHSPIMLPIPGTASIEHLEQNVAAGGLKLTGEEIADLESSC